MVSKIKFPSSQPVEIFLRLFLPFYCTSSVRIKWQNLGFQFLSFHSDVQDLVKIKQRETIALQISRDRCKERTLIFKTVVDPVVKTFFQWFRAVWISTVSDDKSVPAFPLAARSIFGRKELKTGKVEVSRFKTRSIRLMYDFVCCQ